MRLLNLLPSMLSISLCFSLLVFSCSDPTKRFSNAENIDDANNSTTKGMFVFGDSFVDNGNNNFLETVAKADYLPYGMDFPLGPSGRYNNGKTFTDVLGDLLNLTAFIPPFFDPSTKGNHTAVGVNYASGGSGILNETSSTVLCSCIKKFEDVTLPELQNQGEYSSRESLSKYLFVIGSGTNDYILNYFMNGSQSNVSVQEFTANLTATFSSQLKPPSMAAQRKRKGCNKSHNEAVQLFSANLRSLVKGIRPKMLGSKLVMVNAYKIIRDMIRNPDLNGFSDTKNPCCQMVSTEEGWNQKFCKRGGATCEDRNKFVYFDGLHPTEAVNVVLATKDFSSNLTRDVYPFSIRKLAQI